MSDISFKSLIEQAQQDPEVLAVLLFGSHAREEARPDSDVDICLVLMPGVLGSQAGFEKRLTYMANFNIDAHIYQQVPLYIRQRILKEGKVLYVRDEELLYETACRTITEFADYEHMYHDYLKEIARG